LYPIDRGYLEKTARSTDLSAKSNLSGFSLRPALRVLPPFPNYHWSIWQAFGSFGGQTGTGILADAEVLDLGWVA